MGKQLDKKTKVYLKSEPRGQTIAIRILPKISRGNGNQTMELGQLIEYSTRNTFGHKSCNK